MHNNENFPLISVVLLAYNHKHTIRDALTSIFLQSYPNLEVIISDDFSTDGTIEIIEEFLGSQNKKTFLFNQNDKNLGIAAHINKVFSFVSSELVILAAGDDVSSPYRVSEIFEVWKKNSFYSCLIYSNCNFINKNGKIIKNFSESVYRGNFELDKMIEGDLRILGATVAVTKDLFFAFGEMDKSVIHEDRVLPFRALLGGGRILFIDKPLVNYRVDGGISRLKNKNKYDFFQLKLFKNTLPDAFQRLNDLLVKQPENIRLIRSAKKTILDYQATIALIESSWFKYEYIMMYYFFKGVRYKKIFKLYLKLRFYILFKFYVGYKFGKFKKGNLT